jgi:glucosamine-6-phosphate deaminase
VAEVVIVDSAAAAGELAAGAIARLVQRKPDAVLGLATGSTPLTTWAALRQAQGADGVQGTGGAQGADGAHGAGGARLDLSRVRAFALDEYVGLPPGHPQSYRAVIDREVVEPLGLTPSLVHVPADDGPVEGAGERYEAAIQAAGGVDLQVLGIGRTGHIGFNEPGSSFASLTRVKTLAEQTRLDNARFFGSLDEVPRHCITQGLGTILRARHLVLLAFGESKAESVAGAVEGPLTASLPASAIQLHPHVSVIVDEAAASRLAHADYYRAAWAGRFEWEHL